MWHNFFLHICGSLNMLIWGWEVLVSCQPPSPNKLKKKKTPTDVKACEAGMVHPSGQMHPQQVDNPALTHLSVDSNLHSLR